MRKLLLVILPLLIFALFHNKAHAAKNISDYEIKVTGDTQISNDITFDYKFKITGDSNQSLTSGAVIEIPYKEYKVQYVLVDGQNIEYTQAGNEIRFALNGKFLKNNQNANIEIRYTADNLIKNYPGGSILELKSINKEGRYRFTIDINSQFETRYINTPGGIYGGEADRDLVIIWTKSQKPTYKFDIEFNLDKEYEFVPIISENIGYIQKINSLTGAKKGYLDQKNNFYLYQPEQNIKISGELFDQPVKIDSLPFQNINTHQGDYKNTTDIKNYVLSTYSPTTNLVWNGLDPQLLFQNEVKNNIEYALITSSLLTKAGIPNRVVYGFVEFPSTGRFLHYWVQLENEGVKIDYDLFLADLFELSAYEDIKALRFPIGLIDENNIEFIASIELLNKAGINYFHIDTDVTNPTNEHIIYDFDLEWNNYITLTAINNTDFFSYLTASSSDAIYNQLKNILILPNSVREETIQSKSKVEWLSFSIDYQLGNSAPQQTAFDIKLHKDREIYLKIGAVIFPIVIVSMIILRYLNIFFIRKKNLKNMIRLIKKQWRNLLHA